MDFSPVERQRNGGAPPEAGRGRERSEPGNHRGFPAVLRTAPPRHFVPLPHSANRSMGEKSFARPDSARVLTLFRGADPRVPSGR